MTDQVRRNESAESELLDTLLDAADAPVAQPAAATPEPSAEAGAAAQPTPEDAAQEPAAAENAAEVEPVAETTVENTEAEAEPVAEATAENTEAEAEPVAEATAEPVAEATAENAETEAEPVAEATAEPVAEATVENPEAEPVAEAAGEPAATADEPASEASEGASFTPVAEEGGSRPRKLKDLQPGMELEGRVTSIALYGVFVDIGVGRDGLVHISEMSDTRIDTPSDVVAIGDTVRVKIKSVDPDARRISLTMRTGGGEKSEGGRSRGGNRPKRAEVDRDKLSSLKVGDVVDGVITGFAPFGAFADIGVGKDGLIHVSELAEGRVEKAEDAVKVGDRFQFKVLEVDPEGTRISLSLRRAQRTQKMQQLENGQVLDGTVSGIAPFGAFVDIGVGRDGLVHISALSTNRVNKVEDVVKVGDKVTVKVLEVDQQSKRISLTMRLEEPEGGADDDEDYTSSAGATAARPSAAASARFASAAEARAGRDRDRERRERRERDRRNAPAQPETYSTEDVEEEFVGDATLEDLLSKFGGASTSKRDRKGGKREEEEEDGDNRDDRRQRDAIKRTLQQVGRDE
jgi:predicted RNA-binding protein with RPS1 domain